MFSVLTARFRTSLEDVKSVVSWQDELRDLLHGPTGAVTGLTIDATSLVALQSRAPKKIAWQIFDHCASVTRLYALFEDAVCALVGEYVNYLPTVTPNYADLGDRVRTQHRIGVGTILTKWSQSNPLYGTLAEKDIAGGLADGLRANGYSILADAFLVSPENFRSSALTRLFADLGFENAMAFVRKDDQMKHFMTTRLSSSDTVESFLDGFVKIRNESSHGNIGNLVSAKKISDYADFLAVLVDAFALLLRSELIKTGLGCGRSIDVGEVLLSFSNNVVGVSALSANVISIGDRLYAGKKGIEVATVISLQVGSTVHQSLNLTPGFQFGVRFDKPFKVGAHLYRWVP